MTRVALNGRFTGTPQPTGTQIAAFHLFDSILRANTGFDLVIFGDSRFGNVRDWSNIARVTWIETPFQDWSRARAQAWEQFQFPLLCRRHRCAIAHHPINTSPAWTLGCRTIVTLHDLNFLLHPEWFSRAFRLVYSFCAMKGLRRAARVVTISNYVLESAKTHLGIPAERLRMVHNGIKPIVAGPPANLPVEPYVLCVGAIPPHKNLARLIRAFQLLHRDIPQLELRIVGRAMARQAQSPELAPLLAAPGVKRLGYRTEAELAADYANAAVFCYPSLEEGFGLPILEAMSAGTPVVTSSASCLPEIAGAAAVLVDPFSPEAIAEGLRRVLSLSPADRAAMIAAGRARAAEFSWQKAAEAYLAIYKEM